MNKKIHAVLIIFMLIAGFKITEAQTPIISFQSLPATLSEPVDIVNAADGTGRMFIVEKPGRIRIYKNGILQPIPFLNISSLVTNDVGGERGFLSLAFHPGYASNGYFFVYYDNLAGNISIARYQVSSTNPDSALFSSGVILMTIVKPFSNHNGGKLNFGPDGYLYFGTGDGGSGGDPFNNSQNGNSLLGKMIRIDVSNFALPSPYYSIPPGNPYTSNPSVLDEIYNMGLRNPWRWSFDRLTGDTWLADVGQGAWEEVNFKPVGTGAAANYGWRCYEGNHAYNTSGCAAPAGYSFPVFEYPHNGVTGGYSITGGYVYRGNEFPLLKGFYICADYVSSNAWLIKPDGAGGWLVTQEPGAPGITGFGEAEDGTLYAVSLSGVLYKVNAFAVIPLKLVSFAADKKINSIELNWETANEQNSKLFEVEYSQEGQRFSTAGTVAALNTTGNHQYRINYPGTASFFRLKIVDLDGRYSYSQVIHVSAGTTSSPPVFPNTISNGILNIYPSPQLQMMQIFDAQGKQVLSKKYNSSFVHDAIDISFVSKGIYWVKLVYKDSFKTERILVQ